MKQDVAESLDIHPFMLSRWIKEVREGKIVARGKKVELDSETVTELRCLKKLEKEHERLKVEHALLKNAIRFCSEQKQTSSASSSRTGKNGTVKMMCRFYGVSRAGYYTWQRRKPSHRKRENAELVEVIKVEHDPSMGTYGSPRISEALQQHGFSVSENRVARLMQAHGVMARSATLYHANPGAHAFFTEIPNRICRLGAAGPDQIWVGDITYLRVGNKWRYLAMVMDMNSRRILGRALGKNRKVDLTLRALNYAVRNRQPESSVYFHSDRGIEYAGLRYRRRLRQLGFNQSMNRPGKMTDNAHMESFFHSFKSDVYHGLEFRTEASIRDVLRRYMPFYNQRRLHSGLGYVPPTVYEAIAA